jgi:hypothetical protein
VACRIHIEDRRGVVIGSVVTDENREVGNVLGEKTIEQRPQIPGAVVSGEENLDDQRAPMLAAAGVEGSR